MSTPTIETPKVTASLDVMVRKEDLVRALTFARLSISSRAPVPVLSGVLLTMSGDGLRVEGFDFDSTTGETIPATGTPVGQVLVGAAMLANIVKAFDKAADVALSVEDERLLVSDGEVSYTLLLLPLDEYPKLPPWPDTYLLDLPGEEFFDAFDKVSTAASRDDTLPILTGIQVNTSGPTVQLLATDRYRLAAYDTGQHSSAKVNPVLRARTVEPIAKAMRASARVLMTVGDPDTIGISDGSRRAVMRTVIGEYPAITRLFPDETAIVQSTTVGTADLVKAIKQVSIVAERNTPVRFTFGSRDEIRLTAGSGDDAKADRPIKGTIVRDDGLGIDSTAFNPTFLDDGVKAIGGDRITFRATHAHKPVVFHAEGDTKFRYLVVPIRIAS